MFEEIKPVSVTIQHVGSVTVATVESGGIVEAAYSKRQIDDTPDEVIGTALAVGRALKKLGTRLITMANEGVEYNDQARRKAEQEAARQKAAQRREARA